MTEAALAGDAIGRLEAFPQASLAHIVDAREALQPRLATFRAAMVEFAREVGVAPFDSEFPLAADLVYREKVRPELERLTDLAEQKGLWAALRSEIPASHAGAVVKALIAIAAGATVGLSALGQAAVGGLVAAADIAGGVYQRRTGLDAEIRSSRLVWLHEAEGQLSEVGDNG